MFNKTNVRSVKEAIWFDLLIEMSMRKTINFNTVIMLEPKKC